MKRTIYFTKIESGGCAAIRVYRGIAWAASLHSILGPVRTVEGTGARRYLGDDGTELSRFWGPHFGPVRMPSIRAVREPLMIVAIALPGQYVLFYDRSKGKMIRTEHSCVTQTGTRQRKLASGLNYELQEISPESYVWIGSLISVIAPHLQFDLKGATPPQR